MTGKRLLFFIFMPLVIPSMLFLNATYDWWAGKAETNKIIFFLLAPLYAFLALLFHINVIETYFKLAE